MKRMLARSSGVVIAVGVTLISFTFGQSADANGDGAAIASSEFCAPRVARDFLRPLSRMTPISRVPSSGKLPFAPRGLTLEARGGRLVVGGGWIGFGFSDEAVGQIRRLNWDVSAQLVKVNPKGTVVAELDSKRRQIGSIRGNRIKDFLFRVAGEPAFYRVDISLRSSDSHRTLGKFSNYVRVVNPRFDTRLLVSGPVAHRGEVISVRLANFGTESVSSISPDWRFAVQRFDGQGWVPAAGSPPPKKHKAIVQRLPAGQMDECVQFHVPTFEDPGSYRFVMVVERSLQGMNNRTVQLAVKFDVSGRTRARRLSKLSPGRAGNCYRFSVPAEKKPGRYRFLTKVGSGPAGERRTAEFFVRVVKQPSRQRQTSQ